MELKPKDRSNLIRRVCALLETGVSLQQACTTEQFEPNSFMTLMRAFGVDGKKLRGNGRAPSMPVELESASAFTEVGGCGSASTVKASFALDADFDPATGVSIEGRVSWRTPIDDGEAWFDEDEGGDEETDEEREQRREEWEDEQELERAQRAADTESQSDSELIASGLRSVEEIRDAVDAVEGVCGMAVQFSGDRAATAAKKAFPWLPESILDPAKTHDAESDGAATDPPRE